MIAARILLAAAALAGVGACSDPPPPPPPTAVATPATMLRDNVPLPAGAELVSGPTPTETVGNATGWTAVAVWNDPTVDAATAAARLEQALSSGWRVSPAEARSDGSWLISASAADASPGSGTWLSASAVPGRAGTGAALLYRVATAR